ncbi:MAG: DNA repair exonuclease [Candidatus Aenigmatarchaeota archaeon]
MKIAILSDFHFGFAWNPELEDDSFENAEEAMEKALRSDLILILGDIFDSRVPKTQTWAKAMKVLVKPLLEENRNVKLIYSSKELKKASTRTLNHLPVIAIHGTHERRGKGELNAVEVLENAGLLIHLHCQTIILEKNGIKVAIHGMSGVPERFARDILQQWNPQPIKDSYNILLLHQSIDPYIYSPLEPPTISVSNLPKGFDLIIDGHIHQHEKYKINGTTLLFSGSTIVTQFEKVESEIEKGIYFIELDEEIKTEFVPLEKNRKFLYEEIQLNEISAKEEIEHKIEEILKNNFSKPPIIKLKLKGKGIEILDQDLRSLERKYLGKAVIIFAKDFESPEIQRKTEFLRALREQKLSVEDIGMEIFRKNLDELNFSSSFDFEHIFRLLSENEVEKSFNILIGEQKTLEGILKKSLRNFGVGNDNKS